MCNDCLEIIFVKNVVVVVLPTAVARPVEVEGHNHKILSYYRQNFADRN